MKKEPSYEFCCHVLAHDFLPFWEKAVDHAHGGVFTCFDNRGNTLLSHDKYTWSQGRFLWMWSRLISSVRGGIIPASAVPNVEQYEKDAHRTAEFLSRHAFMENGNVIFLLSESGEPKYAYDDGILDSSIYADCFVALGFAQYAVTFSDREYARKAGEVYANITERVDAGTYFTQPYPVPERCAMHGLPMFAMYTGSDVARAFAANGLHREAASVRAKALSYASQLDRDFFVRPYNLEVRAPADLEDTLLVHHLTPGHTLECLWFYLHLMDDAGTADERLPVIDEIGRYAFDHGWDKEYGGLFRFVDRTTGGEPSGRLVDDPYESLIRRTWDTKLWWVHSEALYFTALMARRTGSSYWKDANLKLFDYVFSAFPNPDRKVGEWIQIRNRDGSPRDEVVALPVKDPYHIVRNLLLLLELYHG